MQELQSLSAIAFPPPPAVEPPEESLLQQQGQAQAQAPSVKCPRCESSNTKFCYYNNYNLSQPRHFCKNCRRYWTKGGALRNIPVGGGTRKTNSKRPNPNSSSPSPTSSSSSSKRTTSDHHHPPLPKPDEPPSAPPLDVALMDHDKIMSLDFTGSFSSLLHSNGHCFENILDHPSSSSPLAPATLALGLGDLGDLNRPNDDNLLTWAANGWPDLAIYTPGSTFQ